MELKTCTLTVYFPTISDIRKHIFEFENVFGEDWNQFELIPTPEGVPPQIPRITATTKDGHTTLFISQQNIQLQINFFDKYSNDIERYFEYIQNKIDQLNEACSILKDEFYYVGITVTYKKDGINDAVSFVRDREFIKIASNMDIDQVSMRIGYKLKDKYYFNISMETKKRYEGIPQGDVISLADLSFRSDDLFITLDINDKFSFNSDKLYKSNFEELNNILKIMKNFTDSGLDDFLTKGELSV